MPDLNTIRPDTSLYPIAPANKLMMPAEAMGPAIGVAQGLQNLDTSKFDLVQKQMVQGQQLLGSIVANPTLEQVTNVATTMHNMGLPAPIIAQGVQEFAAANGDPAKIREIALNHLMRHADIQTQLQAGGAAAPAMIDNGQQLNPTIVRSGIRPGIAPAGGNPMQKYMSPEGAASPVAGPPTPSGAPTTVPLGGYAERAGQVRPNTYTRTAPTPTAAPMATSLAPGEGEAKRATGAGSGQSLAAARDQASDYQRSVFPLEQAIPALEKLGKTGTGPGTEQFNQVKSFLQSAGLPGIDVEKIKNFDEAKKYLTDFVNQNGSTGTNDKLAAAFAGNPSVNISNAAAVDVAKSALSLRRMKQAQLDAFEKAGLPESDYSKFVSKWNVNNDPRVYGFDMMTPTQRKAVLSSLPEAKRQMFMFSVQQASEDGLIKAPK